MSAATTTTPPPPHLDRIHGPRPDLHRAPIRFHHGRERGHYGLLPGSFAGTKDGRWSAGYERLPRGATTLNGCVKAVCHRRVCVCSTILSLMAVTCASGKT